MAVGKRLIARLIVFALALFAAAGVASAETRWTMVRSGTLTVIGDQSANTLRDIAIKIEQFRNVVGSSIHDANRPLPLPTVVFVFGQRKSLDAVAPLYNGKPTDIGGYFGASPLSNYIVLSLEGFEESWQIAFHEYTHLLVNNAVRSMPVWLSEGLAEYFSSYKLMDGGKTAYIGAPLEGRTAMLRDGYVALSQIIAVDRASPMYNEGVRRSIFYAESWALTHYLLTAAPNGGEGINKYVLAISEGREPEAAFEEAFGMTTAQCDRELRQYVRKPTFTAMRYRFTDRVAIPLLSAPQALSASEVDAWVGDAQRRVRRIDEAAVRIERAAAAEPQSPTTQWALGLLRLEQERQSEGLEALQRAAELSPDDFMTQFAYGVSLLREARNHDEPAVTAASAALARAIRRNAASSEAFSWLAYAQMLSRTTLSEARASIERAIALSPGRIDYRLRYADIAVLLGEIEDARALLTKIAAIKTDSLSASAAAKRLDAIAASQRRRASRPASDRLSDPGSGRVPDPGSGAVPDPRGRSVETPGIEQPNPTRPHGSRLLLRDVGPDEQRRFGALTAVDCASTEVRFTVTTANGVVVAAARRMEDVELIAYLAVKDFALSCGVQREPAPVYLTWRPGPTATVGVVGTAVAVEFLPKDYVP